MQCPKCGSLNPDTREQCSRCGGVLSAANSTRPVPDWRKEVTRKVKAYDERKKTLTTPPGPIKDKNVIVQDLPTPPAEVKEVPPSLQESKRSFFESRLKERKAVAPPPPPAAIVSTDAVVEDLDIWNNDLVTEEPPKEIVEVPEERRAREFRKPFVELEPEPARAGQSYFWRRTSAFLVDSLALLGTSSVLLYVYAVFMQDDVISLLRTAWPAIGELFLLAHFLYYLYFYSTSRQTPGQVFFSIELRDLGGRDIPFHKILVRWLSMVLFNILNLLPLFFGKTQFLLDIISGTEIRALK